MIIDVYTTKGIKKEIVHDEKTFPYNKYLFCKQIRGHKKTTYYDLECGFDIETTSLQEYENFKMPLGFMYQWQMCIGEDVIFGRYWEEFTSFLDTLTEKLQLSVNKKLVIYVHNLAFEYQFMKNFVTITDAFFKDKRIPLKFTVNECFEFRCSYFLTNMSLERWCDQTPDNIYCKNVGYYNYRKIRTPSTALTPIEMSYCYNDVRGLCVNIRHLLEDDNIADIPLTSTGYVRRECRSAMQLNPDNRKIFLSTKLTLAQYKLIHDAFMGGYTHCNYKYAGILLEDLDSYDITSSYPFQMMDNNGYPIGKFIKVNPKTQEEFEEYSSKYACVMDITIEDLELREEVDFPYISYSKCKEITKEHKYDNGKVMSAKLIRICITDVDLRIIRKVYKEKIKIYVHDMYIAKKGPLPKELKQVIYKYYHAKTTLKNTDYYYYLKSKNKLNAIYGMMVSDILRRTLVFDGLNADYEKNENGEYKESDVSILNKYYQGRNSFLPYQWGVWVTAFAREMLFDSILNVKGTVYVDTDSNKHFKLKENEDYFNLRNDELMNKKESIDYTVEFNGKKYTLGVWDRDKPLHKFISYGSKKYAYVEYNEGKKGTFHITVSGMNKEKGRKKIKNIKNFTLGKMYEDVGRTCSWYNENTEPYEITVNGETFTTASNIAVLETTYTLGVTNEYGEQIEDNRYRTISEKEGELNSEFF
ncbi:MAG: hypothetical protein K2G70_07600 [Turicibacter sp.]|nr:hypothetical protein [Turicibacter sp.]